MDCWERNVIEPFTASNWNLNPGDVIEFMGQMDSVRGMVLIGVGVHVAVWANAADVAKKTKASGVTYLPSQNVELK